MKIHVVVAGFNRALSTTLPSIERHVISPLRELSDSCAVDFVINRSAEPIYSAWSGEKGSAEYELPTLPEGSRLLALDQAELDVSIEDYLKHILGLAAPPTERDHTIVVNLVRYLSVLERARNVIDPDADYVFHTRPDLIFLDRLRVQDLLRKSLFSRKKRLTGIAVPRWGGGLAPNDRYALVHRTVVQDYFGRLTLLEEFLVKRIRFGAENLLGYAMRERDVLRIIEARAARVRIGGEIKKERFDRIRRSDVRYVFSEKTTMR